MVPTLRNGPPYAPRLSVRSRRLNNYRVARNASLRNHILTITRRCVEQGVVFTVCPTSTSRVYGWPDLSRHPIRTMVARGLKIMINSDDPPMFGTDLGNEYVVMAEHMGFTAQDFKQFVLNGIDGSWLNEGTKRHCQQEWACEIDSLIAQLGAGLSAAP